MATIIAVGGNSSGCAANGINAAARNAGNGLMGRIICQPSARVKACSDTLRRRCHGEFMLCPQFRRSRAI
jgi:hypothetical protein